MNKPDPRKALGRGISALMPARTTAIPTPEPESPAHQDAAQTVPIGSVDPNPLQPRRVFDHDKLEELAQSIRANGIIQPLIVRKAGERLQLVAGERRLRAAKLAGLTVVPVVVQDISDSRLLEITLIENIQREELNPIETAIAFERLGRELNLIPEEIGKRTGKNRSTIANTIRLLQLPQDVQQMLIEGSLKEGHARSLLKLPNSDLQREIAARAVAQDWSVRQIERATLKIVETGDVKKAEDAVDPNVKAAIDDMERALGTKVRIIEKSAKKGRIEIEYYSSEDLDRIYEIIVKP
jgi:ParB family chromosome partitioning protein